MVIMSYDGSAGKDPLWNRLIFSKCGIFEIK